MDDIDFEYKDKLKDRVREQISLEIAKDVSALYGFTLPAIRTKRISVREDEPELTKRNILQFVEQVQSAIIETIEIERFYSNAESYSGSPAAIVIAKVRYNESESAIKFRTVWVLEDNTWYSTSINKQWFNKNA